MTKITQTEYKIVLTKIDFHNTRTHTLNTAYLDDPLGLQQFIDAFEALEELNENNAFASTFNYEYTPFELVFGRKSTEIGCRGQPKCI